MMRVLPVLALLFPAVAFAGHELDNRNIGEGRTLYRQHCASCHGARLEGQPNWPERIRQIQAGRNPAHGQGP